MDQVIPAGHLENPHASFLRPDQILEIQDDIKVSQAKMHSPYIQDKGEVQEQLRRMQVQLEAQAPKPYRSDEVDRAVKREEELRGLWLNGMLSQEEMRKSPAGAPDAHRAWEKRQKANIFEWQNIMRRLHVGTDDTEVCSIERFRPTVSTMGMHDALIPGKQYHLPPVGAAPAVTFSDEQLAVLRTLNPALADQIALANNVQRAEIKTVVEEYVPQVSLKGKPRGERYTQEERDEIGRRLKAGKAKKAAEKAAKG